MPSRAQGCAKARHRNGAQSATAARPYETTRYEGAQRRMTRSRPNELAGLFAICHRILRCAPSDARLSTKNFESRKRFSERKTGFPCFDLILAARNSPIAKPAAGTSCVICTTHKLGNTRALNSAQHHTHDVAQLIPDLRLRDANTGPNAALPHSPRKHTTTLAIDVSSVQASQIARHKTPRHSHRPTQRGESPTRSNTRGPSRAPLASLSSELTGDLCTSVPGPSQRRSVSSRL